MASNFLCADTDELNQHRLRYSDMNEEPRKMLLPIEGFERMPLVPLTDAVKPLISIVPDIDHKASVARQNSDNPEEGLSPDESASIMLYSMEGQLRETNVYFVLNSILRSNKPDHPGKLKPWLLYLKLFITALTRLPSQVRTIYREVKEDLSAFYPEDKTFVWRRFRSCTTSMKTLKSEQFLGKTGIRTLFAIKPFSGKDIRRHPYYPTEDEILLIAAGQFEVVACLCQPPDLHIIQVKEVESTFPHLKLETDNLSLSTVILHCGCIRVLTFDDVPHIGSIQSSAIPNGYGGLNWVNATFLNTTWERVAYGWNRYATGLSSGILDGFNGGGSQMSMYVPIGQYFQLNSLVLAAAWNNNLMLTIKGWKAGVLLYQTSTTLQVTSKTTLYTLKWSGIDKVTFDSAGGTPYPGLKGIGTNFVLDDLDISI